VEESVREEAKLKQQYESAYRQLLSVQKELESMSREHSLSAAELGEAKRALSVAISRSAAQAATIDSLESQLVRSPLSPCLRSRY
jgi:hypothetical protein